MRHFLVVSVVAALSRAAFAQDPLVQDGDPAKSPGFLSMDRQDGRSVVGAEAAYLFYGNLPTGASITPVRFDLYGRYIDPDSGFGGYAQIPISYAKLGDSTTNMDQSYTGIGDLEIGGIYVPKISTPGWGLIVHAGLTLPTGSSAKGNNSDFIGNAFDLLARPVDYYQIIPSGVSMRLGLSPVVRQGQLFARADFGLDVNLSQESSPTVDSFMHVNVGGGVDLGSAAITLELVNLYNTKSMNSGDFGSNWIDEGAVSVRFAAGQVQPYVGYVFPVDHDSHDLFTLKFDGAVTFGAAALIK